MRCPFYDTMASIAWNPEKARLLREDAARGGVGFEECVVAIEEGRVLDDIPNPGARFAHQRMLVLNINNYAYIVPYVQSGEKIFLKTVFPSRKHTALYLME